MGGLCNHTDDYSKIHQLYVSNLFIFYTISVHGHLARYLILAGVSLT